MSDKETYHYWFSAGQLAVDPGRHTFVTIDGTEHEYTECGLSAKPSGRWSDYQLVGIGDGKERTRSEGKTRFEELR